MLDSPGALLFRNQIIAYVQHSREDTSDATLMTIEEKRTHQSHLVVWLAAPQLTRCRIEADECAISLFSVRTYEMLAHISTTI